LDFFEKFEFFSIFSSIRIFFQKIQCRVLNCDSVSQVKGKLLDALYKTSPSSTRPSVYEIDLEWHNTQHGRIILQDEDATSICHDGWRKINTLSHYGISESAIMTLVLKSQDMGCTQYGLAGNCEISPYSIGALPSLSRDYTGKIWHLTKPAGSEYSLPGPTLQNYSFTLRNNAVSAGDRDWSQTQRHVPEIFLTRLLSTKGTIQKYIDDLFHLILTATDDVPLPIKWLFDLYDDYGRKVGAPVDPEVIHTWKSNR
jgi:plexin A